MSSDDTPPPLSLPTVSPEPTPDEFIAALNELRDWSGLKLKQFDAPTSTSSGYLNGKERPAVDWVNMFVYRCLREGVKRQFLTPTFNIDDELKTWRRAWSHVDRQWRSQTTPGQPTVGSSFEAADSADDAAETWGGWRTVGNVAMGVAGVFAAYKGASRGAGRPLTPKPRLLTGREAQQVRVWTRTTGRNPTNPP